MNVLQDADALALQWSKNGGLEKAAAIHDDAGMKRRQLSMCLALTPLTAP